MVVVGGSLELGNTLVELGATRVVPHVQVAPVAEVVQEPVANPVLPPVPIVSAPVAVAAAPVPAPREVFIERETYEVEGPVRFSDPSTGTAYREPPSWQIHETDRRSA